VANFYAKFWPDVGWCAEGVGGLLPLGRLIGMERRQWQKAPDTVAPSPTDAADAWNVVEMGILTDDFQVELLSERGDPDVVFGDGLPLGF
jgi:hypothetical protein